MIFKSYMYIYAKKKKKSTTAVKMCVQAHHGENKWFLAT